MIFLLKCIWLDQSGKLATRRWVLYETKLIVNPILPHFASSLSCSSYFSVILYLQLIFSSTLSCLSQLSYLSFTFKILFKLFLLAQLNPLRSHFSTHALSFACTTAEISPCISWILIGKYIMNLTHSTHGFPQHLTICFTVKWSHSLYRTMAILLIGKWYMISEQLLDGASVRYWELSSQRKS